MAKQAQMPTSVRRHLETNMIGQKINGLIIKQVLGCGNTAVTYEVEDRYGPERWFIGSVPPAASYKRPSI